MITNNLPAYIDQTNDTLIQKASLGGKTLGLLTLQTGVKSQSAIMLLDTDVVLQSGVNCTFNDLGSVTVSERVIKTAPIAINQTFCDKKLLNSALQYNVRVAADANALPYEAEFVSAVTASIIEQNENLVWKGVYNATGTTTNDLLDGLIKIIKTDVPSGNTVGSTSGLTSANIVAEVDAVFMGIPSKVLGKSVIFMGTDSYRKYAVALQAKNLFFGAPVSSDFDAFYPNSSTKIVAVPGLDGTDFIVAMDPAKVFHGTDLSGDSEVFKIEKVLGVWYLTVNYMLGVQVARPDEIVYRYKA